MQLNCLNLMPQSVDSIIKNLAMKVAILNLLKYIIEQLIISTSRFFINRDYSAFDPHVGETCCQIRALKLILISRNGLKQVSYHKRRIEELLVIKDKIENLICVLKISSNSCLKNTLFNFLKENDCIFLISEEESFLTKSYFLTKFKFIKNNGDTYIDYQNISFDAGVSRKLAKKLTRSYQLSIARHSCHYILEWARNLRYPRYFISFLESMIKIDDDGRSVLPCFHFSDVLFSYIEKCRIPFVLKIKNFNTNSVRFLLYLFSEKKDKYIFKKIDILQDMYIPSFILSGTTEYNISSAASFDNFLVSFSKYGLKNIILSYMATHPQYSGEKLLPFRENLFLENSCLDNNKKELKKYFENMKKNAKKIGCCKENPSLFFIEHIFCDTLWNQYQIKSTGFFKINNNNALNVESYSAK